MKALAGALLTAEVPALGAGEAGRVALELRGGKASEVSVRPGGGL